MYMSYHKQPLEVDKTGQEAHLLLPGLQSANLTDSARLFAFLPKWLLLIWQWAYVLGV